MIELKSITKRYENGPTVFENFSLSLNDGEITALLGASGVGKTTLLNILAGTTGYEGEITGASKPVSFIFQEDRLLPFKTVQKNLEYALGKGDYAKALESVGLGGCESKYPSELSGGMARRVAILRAFLFKSELLLMDEPFGSLDIGVKYRLMELFRGMWERDGRTAVLVTHNVDEAVYLGQRVIVLGSGGEVLLDKKNEEPELLRKEIEALFIGERTV